MTILIVIAIGLAGCGGHSSSPNEPDDSMGIEFLDLSAGEVTSASAVVSFTTSLPTTCFVEYGTYADSLDMTATDLTMGGNEISVDHTVMLEGLLPGHLKLPILIRRILSTSSLL